MEISKIAPILRADKATLIFSAQREAIFPCDMGGIRQCQSVFGGPRPKPVSLLPLPHWGHPRSLAEPGGCSGPPSAQPDWAVRLRAAWPLVAW
jgi:hypothetical protein